MMRCNWPSRGPQQGRTPRTTRTEGAPGRRRRWLVAAAALGLTLLWVGPASAEVETPPDPWAGYLDYAYVFSSAERGVLAQRLDEYAGQSGISLEAYLADRFESPAGRRSGEDEVSRRREAIAYLLRYLASGDADALGRSVNAIEDLDAELGRHENRYWFHYILAHRALEQRDAEEFVSHVLDLWLEVASPLETPYETLRALSLEQSASAGFAAALPYVYENLARIVLLRAPSMGLDQGLDPLGAVVRMLNDGRVGAHPDVIPLEASSKEYLDRIVARLDGPISDAGSLSFTLALFEAQKVHDRARAALAEEGLAQGTLAAFRDTTAAYRRALDRAATTQGHAAVFQRGLRELGELYAARQRLGSDAEVDTPFSVDKAMQVYGAMAESLEDESWSELGFRSGGRTALIEAMRGLWEEIQETSLNATAYHMSRALQDDFRDGEHLRNAGRIASRYLDFFERHATSPSAAGVPDSAWYAAYEAARSYGDAFLAFTGARPSRTEMGLATQRYLEALRLFPFDPALFPAIRGAFERLGQVNDYLGEVRPIAQRASQSARVSAWIERGEEGARRIDVIRAALADDLALMYMGFADGSGLEDLTRSLGELRDREAEALSQLRSLEDRRQALVSGTSTSAPPASPDPAAGAASGPLDLEQIERRIADTRTALERLERQIEARSRALPLYRAALEADDLPRELSARRDHPVHRLIRSLSEDEAALAPDDREARRFR